MPDRTLHILNLGAGVQSTALYLMSMRQDEPEHVPRFDYAIFADTQEEPREVYEHLQWLKSLDGPPILEGTAGKLGNDLILGRNSSGQRFVSIPAYTKAEGDEREGRVRRQCTAEYKIEVIDRTIRRDLFGLAPGQRFPKGAHVHQYMGLSFDEPSRIVKVQARFQSLRWTTAHFPLFTMEMTRHGCLAYLAEVVPDREIPRSACVFCPYHTNAEWRRIRDTEPGSWQRAVEIDDSMRRPGVVCNRLVEKPMYLHRSCVPLSQAPIDTPESRGEQYTFGFAQECEGLCGV